MKEVKEPTALYGSNYTAKDYLSWKFEELVELIKGKVWHVSPAPKSNHQRLLREIVIYFGHFFENKKCEYFFAPFDVYLTHEPENYQNASTVVQPDLCVICDSHKIKEFGCVDAPDLVVEILSKGTAKKDLNDKYNVYQEFGVKEYWVVHPFEKAISVYSLSEGVYKDVGLFNEEDTLKSVVFQDLELQIAEVFESI